VVKPVAPILRDIEIFSGNTILGDGSVIMILDPNGIANSVGTQVASSEVAAAAIKSEESAQHTSNEKLPMLLFRAGDAGPKAVPLSLVARLEDVEVAKIEYSNGQPMVQYRGRLMPLLSITEDFKMAETIQPVLVFADRDRSMGLMVDEIVDIVEERLDIQIGSENQGLMGSAIIAGKSTDIVDAGFYLTRAFRDWFGSTDSYDNKSNSGSTEKVLLVDDSSFFRNMLTPLLTVSGYSVTTVDNAGDALRLCQEGSQFDIIVSDIEMPGMSGFEFVEALRKDERWQNVPVIALSSHATPVDLDRGRKAGFSNHVAKFDRQALLSTLSKTLDHKGAA
jgi:two-component system chemotaxis sensor kinase CheA